MKSLSGRKYSTLRLVAATHVQQFGNLGPAIDNGSNKNGTQITMTRVDEGVLLSFNKKGLPDVLIEASAIISGTLVPEGQEPTAAKAVIISKPAAPGNPVAPGIPGNSTGGIGRG